MRWIALHLPRLSFESWLAMLPPDQREQPAALMNAREVVMCNAAAQRLGVDAATVGRRVARLESALDYLRRTEPKLKSSDLELAQAILVQ